jgi:hypothetical protein
VNDQPQRYDAVQEESGYQQKTSYASMYFSLFEGRKALHVQGLHNHAIKLFYNMLGDFRPLFDSVFIFNFDKITHSFRDDKNYTYSQSVEQIYRLHVSEFAALMVRRGVAPKPDTTLQIICSDAPKDLNEVFGNDSSEE